MDEDAARAAHREAGALIDERKFRDAIEPAGRVCQLCPDWAAGWFNYAIALKHGHRWADCLAACDRAIELDPSDAGGMHWNAGISATALGDWKRARAAWTAYGVTLPDGDGPIEMKLGTTALRVSLDAEPEVVWGTRLDPCRIRIVTVPLPESKRCYGDLVLHDGESRGKRMLGEQEVPVFDELVVLEKSAYGTWSVEATCASADERDALIALFDDVDGAIEDWTESIVMLCSACSLGTPHEHHERDTSWKPERTIGLALRDERDLKRLRRAGLFWRKGIRNVARVL
ncbi:MAG: tetratricopeptide repeat protein [Kofleriaceae bacterium]